MTTTALLDALNAAQASAVDAPDGPLLIFAGAGSGKTLVLTHRIAHVIATRGVRPAEVLAVTFTNKAAREMRTRVEAILGAETNGLKDLWLGTFHSIGARMLRRDGDILGIPNNFTIYDESDRVAAIKRAMVVADVDAKQFAPNRVSHEISAAKNELLNPQGYADSANGYFASVVRPIFTAYEEELQTASALDFDDLLVWAVRLLREIDPIREYYQERFKHVFVDEYQDTNHAQYVMVSLLASKHRNLTVVGDDDQAVYGWRGADVRNILSFRRDYPDATVITLEQNYRSTQAILDTAHAVIRNNTERAAKKLWTERSGGQRVKLLAVYDEREEALAVANEIDSLVKNEDYSLSEMAVLFRTNAQSRAFEDTLLHRGMPYRLVGGLRFYERREVKDLLAYLRLIANANDTVAFERIVNVPRRKIGDKSVSQLQKLARKRKISPFDAVAQLDDDAEMGSAARQSLADFAKLIGSLRKLAAEVPVPNLIDAVLRETGYESWLRDGTPEADERWSNVTELQGLAAEFSALPAPEGLTQFLENVALVSDVDTLDETKAGVTLITLHAVKGLEFPVVFLVGMEEGLLPHVRAMEEGDPGIAEERRLAYVGVTRAQHRLYLLHAFRRHLYGTPKLAEASRFLREIPNELLEVTRRAGTPLLTDSRNPGAVRDAMYTHATDRNQIAPAAQVYTAGMRVTHPKFGNGTILKSTMTRGGEEVVIKFDQAGVKIFAVADAVLRPAN